MGRYIIDRKGLYIQRVTLLFAFSYMTRQWKVLPWVQHLESMQSAIHLDGFPMGDTRDTSVASRIKRTDRAGRCFDRPTKDRGAEDLQSPLSTDWPYIQDVHEDRARRREGCLGLIACLDRQNPPSPWTYVD